MSGQAVAGPWRSMGPMFVCPHPGMVSSEPCDCGFVGDWPYRFIRDENGKWIGREERCPGCGDTERFDCDGNLVGSEVNPEGKARYANEQRAAARLCGEAAAVRARAEVEAAALERAANRKSDPVAYSGPARLSSGEKDR